MFSDSNQNQENYLKLCIDNFYVKAEQENINIDEGTESKLNEYLNVNLKALDINKYHFNLDPAKDRVMLMNPSNFCGDNVALGNVGDKASVVTRVSDVSAHGEARRRALAQLLRGDDPRRVQELKGERLARGRGGATGGGRRRPHRGDAGRAGQ